VRQADGLQVLGDGIEDTKADADLQLAPPQGQQRAPEHDHHDGCRDREADREEVGRGQHANDVADQEEGRTPHRGDAHEQQRREETRTR